MLEVAPGWVIPSEDLEFQAVRSSGPGGQNVNKLSSKVELRFGLAATAALSPAQKRRLAAAFPSHVTRAGDFLLTSDRFRSRLQNQRDLESMQTKPCRDAGGRPKRRIDLEQELIGDGSELGGPLEAVGELRAPRREGDFALQAQRLGGRANLVASERAGANRVERHVGERHAARGRHEVRTPRSERVVANGVEGHSARL